ncbi:MAG: DUF2807 domain-containing protein [Bacteroidota bacterium]
MKITPFCFLFVLLSFSLNAQKNGNGQLSTRTIPVADFHEIRTNFPVTATINCGASTSVVMTTDDNLFQHILVEAEDGILYIQQKGWVEATEVTLEINVPNLKRLETSGYGEYIVKNIDADEFRLTNPVGNVTLLGKANTFRLGVETGEVNAKALVAQEVVASIWSFGKATVNAQQSLEGKVDGGGQLIYIKKPATVRVKTRDEGEILSETEAEAAQEVAQEIAYINFKIFNNSGKRIQAYVKGPKGKRFSYGFPLNPLQKRRKNWPVGSKVYKVSKIGTRTLLATIEADDADGVVKLFD